MRYAALFRGINVGGKNKLLMKNLVKLTEDLGFSDVKTYIQSGNMVFTSDEDDRHKICELLRDAVNKAAGFSPSILLLEKAEIESAASDNPYPDAVETPKSLQLGFLLEAPKSPNIEKMEVLKTESESFKLIGKVLYLYTPDGFGISKLASASERLLGVSMTIRNWRSVCRIKEML